MSSEPVPSPKEAPPPALLFEMTRSFVTLARTLNLSHAVAELSSTRQTLRRHITQLETEMGVQLFNVEDRRYSLTKAGEAALPEALDLVARFTMWLRGTAKHHNNMQYVNFALPNGWSFHQQQHPLSKVWNGKSVIMREALRAWAMSGGKIEAPELAHVRPYLIVYRLTQTGWICVEFGEECFYVKWFGWAKARSSVGRSIGNMPGGENFARLLEQPFSEVTNTQGARLDHVSTQVPRGEGERIAPIRYARLMMGGQFPDGSTALFALVEPIENIEIEGVDPTILSPIPADVMIKFDKNEAKFEQIVDK
jgi:biotin operon repressor